MPEQRTTLRCPSCDNINPYAADKCLKCNFILAPVRALLEGKPTTSSGGASEAKPKSPAPPLPELTKRPEKGRDIGSQVATHQILIREAAKQEDEIAGRFFARLEKKGLPGVTLSAGNLVADNASHRYYFVEKDLGEGAVATMAVRIDSAGSDLAVQWRHYVLPPRGWTWGDSNFIGGMMWGVLLSWIPGLIAAVLIDGVLRDLLGYETYNNVATTTLPTIGYTGVFLSAILVSAGIYRILRKFPRAGSLRGFQGQTSADFQLSVRAALEEAIDEAQLRHNVLGVTDEKEGERRRLI